MRRKRDDVLLRAFETAVTDRRRIEAANKRKGGRCALTPEQRKDWEARHNLGANRRPVGRKRLETEAADATRHLEFACAVVGQLVECGEADAFSIKLHPGDPRCGGSPMWYPCPPKHREKIHGSGFRPAVLALVAAELGQLAQEHAPQAAKVLKAENELNGILRKPDELDQFEQAKLVNQKKVVLEKIIRKASPDASPASVEKQISIYLADPELAIAHMGRSAVTRYFEGGTARRESSQRLPLHKIRDLGMSKALVRYYRKRPEFSECKTWLRALIGRKIAEIPSCFPSQNRSDLSNALQTYTPAQWNRNADACVAAARAALNSVPAPVQPVTRRPAGDWIKRLSPEEFADLLLSLEIDHDRLESLVVEGRISATIADLVEIRRPA